MKTFARQLPLVLLTLCTCLAANAEDLRVETFRGAEIAPHIEDVVRLSNRIYREYPYCYNGESRSYEEYLESYATSDGVMICIAYQGKEAVGLAAGLPLQENRDLYKPPLEEHGYDLKSIFYIGEFGLEPRYQGEGVERTMYEKLARFAKEGGFKAIALWELDDASNQAERPQGYIPREQFWEELGFIRHPKLAFRIDWINIGETTESSHLAIYWIKSIATE